MESLGKWHDRKNMVFLGTMLIAIGASLTIILFTATPILSLSLFVLSVGFGIFIGYKRKKTRTMLFGAFWMVSWAYGIGAMILLNMEVANEFIPNFIFPTMIALAIGILPFACVRPIKSLEFGSHALKRVFLTFMLYVIMAFPFVFGVMWDYNIRGDTSSPEVIGLKIVDKYSHEDIPYLEVETPDGVSHFYLKPPLNYYNEHNEGDLIQATVRGGAFGYAWIERIDD